jgi:glycosyltransferase involved in cell wall biosynthesis
MAPARVLQVLEATEGGTRRHLRDLVLGLDPDRFELAVAVGLGRGPGMADDLAEFESRGAAVHVGPLTRALDPWRDAAALAWLTRLMARGRFDLVHAHSSKAGFLGRLAARRCGLPAVYTPHGWAFLNPEFSPAQRRAFAAAERLAAGWGRAVIAVSSGEARAAERAGIVAPGQITVIRNGIDIDSLADASGTPSDGLGTFNVLTVGRRAAQKGDAFLLAAWPLVVARFPQARLTLVGDGPLLAASEAQARRLGIADSVCFAGRVEGAARLIAGCDVFVLPSLFEGCPYSLLEALALGRSCLATAVDGAREVIAAGRSGLLVPPGDSAALAAGLLRLASDEALRARLGAAAAGWARRHLALGPMIAATAALYERLLAARR